jgi:tetratricopeptide (TPR) repeat protein
MVSEVELLEVFRLGEAASDAEIVREVGDRLASRWHKVSRFRDVQALAYRSLGVQSSPTTLTWAAMAEEGLANLTAALGNYERVVSIARETGDRSYEAVALNNIGLMHDRRGDWQRALNYLEQALPIARELGITEATTLNNIGLVYDHQGDQEAALDYFWQALSIHRERGNRPGEATTLVNIGMAHYNRGNGDVAIASYALALPIFIEVGDRASEAGTLNNIGMLCNAKGDGEFALACYEKALSIFREIGDRAGEGGTLSNIGMVYHLQGDGEAALPYYEEALPIRREVEDRAGEVTTRYNIAMVHRDAGRLLQAVTELGLVVALEEALRHPNLRKDSALLEQLQSELYQRGSPGGTEIGLPAGEPAGRGAKHSWLRPIRRRRGR